MLRLFRDLVEFVIMGHIQPVFCRRRSKEMNTLRSRYHMSNRWYLSAYRLATAGPFLFAYTCKCRTQCSCRVSLKYADKLWGWVPRTETRKQVHINLGWQTLPLRVTALKWRIYEKCSKCPPWLNTCLGMSYYGLSNTSKDPWIVADSLAGDHNVLMKCLYVVNRSWNKQGL
jgi:hypothetical protein